MKKSNVCENSKGVVLFAFNSAIDYISIAEKCARLVQKHLCLPVTLITDSPQLVNYAFDSIIQVENTMNNIKSAFDNNLWRNADRYLAYDLSPYDETLLIDVDYLVLDNSLLILFSQLCDYQIMENNQTLDESWNFNMGAISLPYKWATVIFFRKSRLAKQLFDLTGRIQRNYAYYRLLYNIREPNFRNDYAFSIADYILNGYTSDKNTIKFTMLTLEKPIEQMQLGGNFITVREKDRAHLITRQNIHIMNKQYLISEDFEHFVDDVCKE
jgi:hypothetical protein